MNKWVLILGVWVVILVGIIAYSQSYKGKKIDLQAPKVPSLLDLKGEGPEVGDVIEQQESPQQVISRFLQYVNTGDYEFASGLINPNELLAYTSSRRDLTPHDALVAYVRLFPKGEAKSIQVGNGNIQGVTAFVSAQITLNSVKSFTADFQLVEILADGHAGKDRYWSIVKLIAQ